jgi:hypothetical protein
MKHLKNYCLLIFLICTLTRATPIRVSIPDFENRGVDPYLCETFSDLFRNTIFSSNDSIAFIERAHINKGLSELNFQLTGITDSCIIETGKLLGATHIITGTLALQNEDYILSVRVFEIQSSKIIASTAAINSDAQLLTEMAVKGLISQIPQFKGNYNNQASLNRKKHTGQKIGQKIKRGIVGGILISGAIVGIIMIVKSNTAQINNNVEVSFQ